MALRLPKWPQPAWALPFALSILAILGQLLQLAPQWQYQRLAISMGQWWRLFSAHLVHLGWRHLLFNVAALWLVWLLFHSVRSQRCWSLVTLVSMLGVGLGLWWLSPHILWYVGLSGVLHGLFAAGVIWSRQPAWWRLTAGGLLIAKLGWEQYSGIPLSTVAALGGDVVVAAHTYGAFSGAMAAWGAQWLSARFPSAWS